MEERGSGEAKKRRSEEAEKRRSGEAEKRRRWEVRVSQSWLRWFPGRVARRTPPIGAPGLIAHLDAETRGYGERPFSISGWTRVSRGLQSSDLGDRTLTSQTRLRRSACPSRPRWTRNSLRSPIAIKVFVTPISFLPPASETALQLALAPACEISRLICG